MAIVFTDAGLRFRIERGNPDTYWINDRRVTSTAFAQRLPFRVLPKPLLVEAT
jgi:hypothetical protein